jgi:hypothetical protein
MGFIQKITLGKDEKIKPWGSSQKNDQHIA